MAATPDNVEITGVAHGGYGVCRVEGQVCFVPYALPGDLVRLEGGRQAKGVLWARIAEVIEPSPHRCPADCPTFRRCGGCMWLHFAYPAQAEWKRRIVQDCLERIAKVKVDPAWVEDATLRHGYRTRAEFHGAGGRVGFLGLGSREVVDVESCPLCHPKLNAALGELRAAGLDGSAEVVVNPEGDEILVWTRRPTTALRERFRLLNSPGDDERASFAFDGRRIVNGAFSQSSLLLNRLLMREVRETLGGARRVLDLYCGNGNLSLDLARDAACDVVGMDHNLGAVQAAASSAPGDCPKAEYRAGDEAAFREVLRGRAWDAVLLDPPRTGAKAIIGDLAVADTAAIVYVSCDPATLARDVKTLSAHGWRVTAMSAIDLFPHTPHVETVCRMER